MDKCGLRCEKLLLIDSPDEPKKLDSLINGVELRLRRYLDIQGRLVYVSKKRTKYCMGTVQRTTEYDCEKKQKFESVSLKKIEKYK